MENNIHWYFAFIVLIGFADRLRWLDRMVSSILIFFHHAETGQILEVSTGLTVAKVGVKDVRDETVRVCLVAADTSEDEVDFQLFFSRHF